MLRRSFVATAIFAALTACATSTVDANAVGSLADVQVIDRTTGAVLPVHVHRGRHYVAGTPGNRYAITLRNRTGGRLLAVISVDGVNVVTGETAAWDQGGYVFGPWLRGEITGWRKTQERVTAFEFTALPDSYAARTGRPRNVGVIGVALFREAVPAPPVALPRRESGGRGAAQDAAAPSATGAAAERWRDSARLGTGHGRSESAPVEFTAFERAQTTPDEVIAIHYDSRENLIALGVIPASRECVPDPFPGVAGFVPDPPR